MPHQCTACGRGFPDGSRQMLSGCPDCGGTTFQFVPDGRSGGGGVVDGSGGVVDGGRPGDGVQGPDSGLVGDDVSVEAPGPAVTDREGVLVDGAGTEDAAQAAARGSLPGADRLLGDPVGGDGDGAGTTDGARSVAGNGDGPTGAVGPVAGDGADDRAVATDAVGPVAGDGGEIPPAPSGTPDGGGTDDVADAGGSARPVADVDLDAETVAAELDSQFESIRIVEPGRYVINPVELFERDEHVIAVRENGRYVIDVAESRLDGE